MPLSIVVPARDYFNSQTNEIISFPECQLRLEHSLLSISLWESIWHVPFFDTPKTEEQTLSYIKCMTLNKKVDGDVYERLSYQNIKDINAYIENPMTATTITNSKNTKRSTERVTSELIYYWMTAYNIPVEFEKWHINRLIMLIRVCSEKQAPPKKMSKREIMEQNRALNAARRAKMKSKG
jgi:hypothetical protein